MRRLLYLAVVLLVLVVIGLAFSRIVTSGAYVARARVMQVKEGMTRSQVENIMAGINKPAEYGWKGQWCDVWRLEDGLYEVTVHFDDAEPDVSSQPVKQAYMTKKGEKTMLDGVLESLGYPKAQYLVVGPDGILLP